MLKIIKSKSFRKDEKLAKKQNLDLSKLDFVINQLANHKQLDPKYYDHKLSGSFSSFRECHIEPDWILVYSIIDQFLELYLFRTGSHSNIFNKERR